MLFNVCKVDNFSLVELSLAVLRFRWPGLDFLLTFSLGWTPGILRSVGRLLGAVAVVGGLSALVPRNLAVSEGSTAPI